MRCPFVIAKILREMVNIPQLLITIDNNTLIKYNKYYFNLHPKRRKEPIETPHHPSINKWFIMKRPQMNALKQNWKGSFIFE